MVFNQTTKYNPPVTMVYVDNEVYPEITERYQVTIIPTIEGSYKGKSVSACIGPMCKDRVQQFINELVAKSS